MFYDSLSVTVDWTHPPDNCTTCFGVMTCCKMHQDEIPRHGRAPWFYFHKAKPAVLGPRRQFSCEQPTAKLTTALCIGDCLLTSVMVGGSSAMDGFSSRITCIQATCCWVNLILLLRLLSPNRHAEQHVLRWSHILRAREQ